MKYELAKELKEAGYRQTPQGKFYIDADNADVGITAPTLEQLIEACGERIAGIDRYSEKWVAVAYFDSEEDDGTIAEGSTPTEAVAKLWLALNKP